MGYGVWGGYDPGHSSNHRLSWHMHYWYTAGWRAGYASSMNSERQVFKAVYTKLCNGCGVKLPLDEPECKQTSCYYAGGETRITTNCQCSCSTGFKCVLKHHHTTGYLKAFNHC